MTLWRGDRPLVLASQSRARQKLLADAGLDADAIPADLDERALVANAKIDDPVAIAAYLAREKAMHVAALRPHHHVIGADQTLALGARHFNKPADRAQAADQLAMLAGHTHALHSAVCVVRNDAVMFETVVTARLTMRPLNEKQIAAYLDAAGAGVLTSVGAYQIESLGAHLFARIEGDHFTILGLPLLPLLDFFRGQGLVKF